MTAAIRCNIPAQLCIQEGSTGVAAGQLPDTAHEPAERRHTAHRKIRRVCGIQRKTDTKRIPGYEMPAEKYDCEKIMMFMRSIMMGRDDAQCFVNTGTHDDTTLYCRDDQDDGVAGRNNTSDDIDDHSDTHDLKLMIVILMVVILDADATGRGTQAGSRGTTKKPNLLHISPNYYT